MDAIDEVLAQAAAGEISLGTDPSKLPACPKCGKHRLTLRQGHTAYVAACYRSCGFIRSRADYELQQMAHNRLVESGGVKRYTDEERKVRRASEQAPSWFTPSSEEGYDQD